jgi:hypothetical protein
MKPISARCRSSACATGSAPGTPAELLPSRARELEGRRGLGHHRERLDRGHVAPLDECLPRLAGLEVDGAQRPHQRRQRLHRRAHDHGLAVRDAALDPAREVRLAVEAAVGIGEDLVVRLRAAPVGQLEARADLDPLHRLDAHHRRREARVEALLP